MSNVHRSRWAAVGAAVAVTLGAGSIGLVNASNHSSTPSSLVTIEPCRLADTRPGDDNVGDRSTPIGAAQTHTFQITGENGDCDIPAGATGIIANVTALNATAETFVAVYPAADDRPYVSNLNPAPGMQPFPNAVTVKLSDGGAVNVYNEHGTVDVIIDVNAYLVGASVEPAPIEPPADEGNGEDDENGENGDS